MPPTPLALLALGMLAPAVAVPTKKNVLFVVSTPTPLRMH